MIVLPEATERNGHNIDQLSSRERFIARQAAKGENIAMPAGLPLALLFMAQASAAPAAGANGPAQAAAAKPMHKGAECAPQAAAPNDNEIVICAIKPDGYRIDPDVKEARRLKKESDAGRPHNPHETYADNSCARVGPMGCRGGPTIDFIAVALTAAEIAERLSKGQEVGSMFVTDPHPGEYQFYKEAKKQREERAADAAAAALKAEAAKAATAPKPAGPAAPSE